MIYQARASDANAQTIAVAKATKAGTKLSPAFPAVAAYTPASKSDGFSPIPALLPVSVISIVEIKLFIRSILNSK